MKLILGALVTALAVFEVSAATIAVIDSGLDRRHEALAPRMWENSAPLEGSFASARFGWNFTNNGPELLDESLLPIFSSADLRRYYELTGKSFLFQVTPEEREWARERLKDPEFRRLANAYGTFIHGTHVAGIAARASQNKIMGVTYLRTSLSAEVEAFKAQKDFQELELAETVPWPVLTMFIEQAAQRQNQGLREIARFVRLHGARVANGSFGSGKRQGTDYARHLFGSLLGRVPTTEEAERVARILLDSLVRQGKDFVAEAPQTLFVFAAGNDALNNDENTFAPANIEAANVISVAATYRDEFFAPFSNWGTRTVDVAAPGLYIHSAVPGGGELPVSGTSQAAPFVSNVVGSMVDENPALTPAQLKRILVETVDKKDFLKIRVRSGGMVNAARAIRAARLSKTTGLSEAIVLSHFAVTDAVYPKSRSLVDLGAVAPLEMPGLFEL